MISEPKHFPAQVWDAPLLRVLDARARAEIEAAGKVVRLRAGDVLYRAGEPADTLYVVAKGACSLVAIRRGETKESVIRSVGAGEILGEEATDVAFSVRPMEARVDRDGVACEVPVVVLRRALGRLGGGEAAARLERSRRRAAAQDLLSTTAFTRGLGARDVEILLDAARHVQIERGEHLYREGDPSDAAYFIADGLLQAQTDDDGKPRVEAYLSRGDLFGDAELEDHDPRRTAIVACGPAWLVAVPRDVFVVVARKNAALLEGARRVKSEGVRRLPILGGGQTTAHVFKDLYRMRVARSLLVIDQDSCVRCGHCAWSCAGVHDDGISRLVRHGERIVVQREKEQAPLLVPNSCQHCKNPACMIDCPTGAIGRDARGEVFIREDLCTGCGSCAKACPWDNIAMAPRAQKTAQPNPFPDVAVKCDLCSALPSGPACVASCPTAAIIRIDPNEVLVELGGKPALPTRKRAWPWIGGAAAAAIGGGFVDVSQMTSGVAAGLAIAILAAYAGLRRAPRLTAILPRGSLVGRVGYIAHLAVGALAVGLVQAHLPRGLIHFEDLGSGAGATLTIAALVAIVSGVVGAALQAVLPARLARLERRSVLPEELGARQRELDERVFAQLSGKSEVTKTIYARLLRPYRRAIFAPAALALSGRSLRDEEKRLRGRIDALFAGRVRDAEAARPGKDLDELVKVVAEGRAIRAQRLLGFGLRAWVPLHVVAAVVAVLALALHIAAILVKR